MALHSAPDVTQTYGRERLLPLDLLRGLAAVMVALGHHQEHGVLQFGYAFGLCVPFFFILSGYVLAHAYGAEIACGKLDVSRYAVIRLARLYPLHVATMAATAAFWLAVECARTLLPGLSIAVGWRFTWAHVIENLTLTHLVTRSSVSFNTPSWSISVEFWGSFLVFLLLRLRWTGFRAALAGMALAGLAAVVVDGGFLVSAIYLQQYLVGFGCFVIGWAIHGWQASGHGSAAAFAALLPERAWFALAFLVIASLAWPDLLAEAWYYLAFAAIIAALSHATISSPALRAACARAGDWSYGIYLLHIPLMLGTTACARLAEKILGVRVLGTVVMDLVFLPLLLVLAAASYRYLEVPAKRWMRDRLIGSIERRAAARG